MSKYTKHSIHILIIILSAILIYIGVIGSCHIKPSEISNLYKIVGSITKGSISVVPCIFIYRISYEYSNFNMRETIIHILISVILSVLSLSIATALIFFDIRGFKMIYKQTHKIEIHQTKNCINY